MQSLKSLREKKGLTQQTAAKELGVSEGWLQKMELGQIAEPNADYVQRMSKLYGSSPDRVITAAKRMASFSDQLDNVEVAIKNADAEDTGRIAHLLYKIATDSNIPGALRQRAVKALGENDEKIQQSLSQLLAAGTILNPGGIRPGVAGVGPLDPSTDTQGLRVVEDGDGNYFLLDTTTDPPRITPVAFGDMVYQAGMPLGNKSATKSDGSYRDAFGHKRKGN